MGKITGCKGKLHICSPEIRCAFLKVVMIDGIIILPSLEALKGRLVLYGMYWFYVCTCTYIYVYIKQCISSTDFISEAGTGPGNSYVLLFRGVKLGDQTVKMSFSCGETVQSLFLRENPF